MRKIKLSHIKKTNRVKKIKNSIINYNSLLTNVLTINLLALLIARARTCGVEVSQDRQHLANTTNNSFNFYSQFKLNLDSNLKKSSEYVQLSNLNDLKTFDNSHILYFKNNRILNSINTEVINLKSKLPLKVYLNFSHHGANEGLEAQDEIKSNSRHSATVLKGLG
jgi:hypothetical protein